MQTVGFLHTSPVHVSTFDRLVGDLAPNWTVEHLVDEALLIRARIDGSDAVRNEVATALISLAEPGVDLIVCTCSTIGGLAESLATSTGVRVVRVDRPMAELAVEAGRRIGVVAALESTIASTRSLVDEVAAAAGAEVDVELVVVEGAWERFENGDLDGYHALIAEALPELAGRVDVIVLAQASMAPAARLAGDVTVLVLASPRTAVERLLTARD